MKKSNDLIEKGPEATERKKINFEAIFCIVVGILLLTNIVFASLFIHSLVEQSEYERKLDELRNNNASLQATNNELMHDNLNLK